MKKWFLAVFLAMFVCPVRAGEGLPDFSTDLKKFQAQISKMEVLMLPKPEQLPRTVDAFGPDPEKTLRDIVHRLAEHAGLGSIDDRVFIDTANLVTNFDCQEHRASLKPGQKFAYPATTVACPDGEYLVFGSFVFKAYHSTDELAMAVAHELGHMAAGHAAERKKILTSFCEEWALLLSRSQYSDIEKRLRAQGVSLQGEEFHALARAMLIVGCQEEMSHSSPFHPLWQKQEDAADANALDLLRLAGYDAFVAQIFFMHSKECLDALHKPEIVGRHDLLIHRAGKMDVYNQNWPRAAP